MRALLPAFLCCCALAQPPGIQTVTVPSQALPGSRKATILLPGGYDRSPARYPVLYLLHGITGNHEDWTHKTNLTAYAAPLPLIIVMPDGENSWYSNSATRPDYRYEDFIVKELVPWVDANYRSIADRHGRGIAGLSMGGFGAMKLCLKFPELFRSIASFSGALSLARSKARGSSPVATKSLAETFGPDDHEAHAANDPFVLAQKPARQRPSIYFDCGNSDFFLEGNREFAKLLASLKIPYEYREPGGDHNWEYWDRQIEEYLRLLARDWDLRPPRPGPLPAPPPPPPPR